jgi:hypothetical protein
MEEPIKDVYTLNKIGECIGDFQKISYREAIKRVKTNEKLVVGLHYKKFAHPFDVRHYVYTPHEDEWEHYQSHSKEHCVTKPKIYRIPLRPILKPNPTSMMGEYHHSCTIL